MQTHFVKRFLLSVPAGAVLIALAVALVFAWNQGTDDVQAAHEPVTAATPGEDVLLDMIPDVANTDTALGPVDACVSVSDGGTDAADFSFDVGLDGIPLGSSLGAFTYTFTAKPGHDLTPLTVRSFSHFVGGLNILTAQGFGPTSDFTTFPPATLEGFSASATDLGTAETNPPTVRGVMGRYDVDVGAAAPGLYPITLSGVAIFAPPPAPGGPAPLILTFPPDTIIDAFSGFGLIAVDQPCPLQADIQNLNFTGSVPQLLPPPFTAADIPVSVSVPVTVAEEIRNDGPEDNVVTNIWIECQSPESLTNPGTPAGACSFHVTPELYQTPYANGTPGALCDDPLQPGNLKVTIDGIVVASNPPIGCIYEVPWPAVLDVHKNIILPDQATADLEETFDVHCFEPSTHTWSFDKEVQPESQFITDGKQADNFGDFDLTLNCIGFADLQIKSQTITVTDPTPGTPLIGDDGFDQDGDTTADEDGPGDCDAATNVGDNGPNDDDGDTKIDEDGGDCPIIDIAKTIHNQGPFPTVVTDIFKVVAITDPNGNPISGCTANLISSDPVQTDLDISVDEIHDESYVIDCPQLGFGVDDDGDSPEQICGTAYNLALPQCVNFVDEDPPGDGNSDGEPGIAGVDDDNFGDGIDCADIDVQGADYDGDGNVLDPNNLLTGSCLTALGGGAGWNGTQDPQDIFAARFDDDEDGLVDEDGPVSIVVVSVFNLIVPKDPHVIDADLASPCDPFNPLTWAAGLCGNNGILTSEVLIDELPFDPEFTTWQTSDQPDLQTTPEPSITCLITLPCKMQFEYEFPNGNPLAGSMLTVPSPDFTLTRATEYSKIGRFTGLSNIGPLGFACGAVQLPFVIPLLNSALPSTALDGGGSAAIIPPAAFPNDLPGQAAEDATASALLNPTVWATKLNSQVFVVLNAFPDAELFLRKMGMVDVSGTIVPVNVLVFEAFDFAARAPAQAALGDIYIEVPVVGDPDVDVDFILDAIDPDNDNDGILDFADLDDDGDGDLDEVETKQCTALIVSFLELGHSETAVDANFADPPLSFFMDAIDDADQEGSEDLIICNESGAHNFFGLFTRIDIGTTSVLLHQQDCAPAENDVSQILKKDENVGDGVTVQRDTDGDTTPDGGDFGVDDDGDTEVDEDPAGGGDEDGDSSVDEDGPGDGPLPVGQTVGIEVDVIIANVGLPKDVTEDLSIVSQEPCVAEWDINLSGGDQGATVVLDPLISVAGTHISVIHWTEQALAIGETRVITAKYMLTCSAPSTQQLQIESHAEGVGFDDVNPLNNEAMNNPTINASNPDIDGDGVPNAADNCAFAANADQKDNDGDGLGDACDHDDDDDGIADAIDACPLLAEDFDNEADGDGCPETDMSISVDKDDPLEVNVSEDTTFTVTTTATNGNYGLFNGHGVIFFELLKSDVTDPNDKCVAKWIPQPGDLLAEDTVVESFPVDLDGDSTPDENQQRTVFMSQLQVVVNDLPPFNDAVKTRQYTLHCNARSSHLIFLEEGIAPTAPIQDPNVNNNVHKQTIHIDAFDEADIKIVSDDVHEVTGPVGAPEDGDGDSTVDCANPLDTCATTTVTVKKVLHNNGPSTADVLVTTSANVPSDCTATLTSPTSNPYAVSGLQVSVQTTVFEVWEIECNAVSDHTFTFNNSVDTNELHLRDPDLSNNSGSSSTTVGIAGRTNWFGNLTVNAPAKGQLSVSEMFPVTLRLENVGAFPMQPDIWQTLRPTGANAGDCTVSFHVTAAFLAQIVGGGQGLTITKDGVPVSPPTPAGWEPSDVVIGDLGGIVDIHYQALIDPHTEVFYVQDWDKHCFAPSTHFFQATVDVADSGSVPHVDYIDDDTFSNFQQDIEVDADLKIADWFFLDEVVDLGSNNWLIEVPLGAATANLGDRDADSKEKLHNNGPWSPVDATLLITAAPGTGCNVSYEVSGNESLVNGTTPPAAGTVVDFTSAEIPVSLPVSVDVWLAERFGFAVDNHNFRECEVLLEKDLTPDDIHVIDANGAKGAELFRVCLDQDQDGIADQCNANGEQDNCTTVPNPNQEDSDGDGLGDACDSDSSHDLVVKFCIKIGPAPVNISDNQGHYMWALCDIGNHSDHDEAITISLTLGSMPAGCTVDPLTILPGQNTILLKGQAIDNDGDTKINEDPPDGIDNDGDSLIDEDGPDGEQKIILFRVRFECHLPSQPQLLGLAVEVCLNHATTTQGIDDDGDGPVDEDPINGIDDDGDSSIDEDPPNDTPVPPSCDAQIEQVIIDTQSVPLVWEKCSASQGICVEDAEASVAFNQADVITMGQLGEGEGGTLAKSFNGMAALLPPGNSYKVKVLYDVCTWDSYNAIGTTSPGGTGYFDSFGVSVTQGSPYWTAAIGSDPLAGIANIIDFGVGPGGGLGYADGILEGATNDGSAGSCSDAGGSEVEAIVTMDGDPGKDNYLNIGWDTASTPEANSAFPSYGTVKVVAIEVTP
jgi:hypothetical protein